MAAGKWKLYNAAKEYIGDGTINLDSHSFKMALFTSASNANTLTNSTLSQLTNEHAGSNGYTTGGEDLANVTWGQTGGTATFDADDVVWTASGGRITARYAVIYRTGTVNTVADALLAVCLLDTAPADVEATDGNTFTVEIHADGIFTLSGADVD